MKLTPLARSLALADLLSTASLSVYADEAQKYNQQVYAESVEKIQCPDIK